MSNHNKKEREVFWQLAITIPVLFFIFSASWAMSRDWTSKGLRTLSLINGGIGIPIGLIAGGIGYYGAKQARKQALLEQEAANQLPEGEQKLLKEAKRLESLGIKLEEL